MALLILPLMMKAPRGTLNIVYHCSKIASELVITGGVGITFKGKERKLMAFTKVMH